MKTIKALLSIAVVAALTVFSSCGGGDDGGAPSISIDEKLSGNWSLSSVTRDNSDVTGEFSGFSISLSSSGPNSGGGSYSASNGGTLLTSGSYSLSGTSSISFSESSGSVTYSATSSLSNEDKTLTISFYNPTTTFGGGRTEGLAGDYVFVLNK